MRCSPAPARPAWCADAPADPAAVLDLLCTPVSRPATRPTGAAAAASGWTSCGVAVEGLGGSLALDSRPGTGSRFTVRLPLTLVVADVLTVAVGGQTYAVPQTAVREVVPVEPGATTVLENNELVRYHGGVLPLLRLGDVFGLPRPTWCVRGAGIRGRCGCGRPGCRPRGRAAGGRRPRARRPAGPGAGDRRGDRTRGRPADPDPRPRRTGPDSRRRGRSLAPRNPENDRGRDSRDGTVRALHAGRNGLRRPQPRRAADGDGRARHPGAERPRRLWTGWCSPAARWSRPSTSAAASGSTAPDYDLKTRLLVVAHADRLVGLIVDSAREFITIPAEAIQPPPESMAATSGRYLRGVADLGGRIILRPRRRRRA